MHHGGAIELAHSIDYIEQAFQDAAAGRRRAAVLGRRDPDGVRPARCAPKGIHIMSLFTQWVPHEWSKEPHSEELEAYADRVIDGYTELAPNLKGAILHRQVIGPYEMEQDIGLDRGQHLPRRAVGRPAVPHAPGAWLRRLPHPDPAGSTRQSSATHAGGGVCAIPAYNCVREIRRDRRRQHLKNA